MSELFHVATTFNEPIDSWDTSNVTSINGMNHMFNGAYEFNYPIDNWDTSNVKSMNSMFNGAYKFNEPIGSWNTSKVTSMDSMFDSAYKFNQPIGSWNTSKVTSMSSMFRGASRFDQPIDSWDTSSVITMYGMFAYADQFNKPLNLWKTSNVTNMVYMFLYASRFNQDISKWNVANVTSNANFSTDSGLTPAYSPFYIPPDDITAVFVDGTRVRVFYTRASTPTNNWDPLNISVGYSFYTSGEGGHRPRSYLTIVQLSRYTYSVDFSTNFLVPSSNFNWVSLNIRDAEGNIFYFEKNNMLITFGAFT
jgi:surface protein